MNRTALKQVGSIVAFGVIPVVSVVFMFYVAQNSNSLAVDFKNEIYPEAKLLLDGTNPFPGPDPPLIHEGELRLAAVRRLRRGAADAAAGDRGRLRGGDPQPDRIRRGPVDRRRARLARLRRRRSSGRSVLGEVRTAHLTLVLCLLLAVVWRTRERFPFAGLTLGVALALKFFLWPLVIWLAALRRWRDAALAACFASVTLLLLLPFISLPEYARLLRRLGQTFDQDSYTPFGLALPTRRVRSRRAGHHHRARHRRPRDRLAAAQSFVLFVAAALMLSPIVWLDYYAVLAVPLAIVRPRLSPIWLLPLLTWGITTAGPEVGHVETSLRTLSVFAVVTIVVARAERGAERIPARSRPQREAVPSS